MSNSPMAILRKLPRSGTAAALAASLVLGALLTALALRTPDFHWLVWISFLPLFVAVWWLRPATATLAGGLWGACLYLFSTAGPSAWLLALLMVIPAVYVGLAARPARAIGFKLLTLALGWTLIEVVIHLQNPSGPHEGLLAGSQADAPHLHWLARLLGYVCSAFLVACANASLLGILRGTRLSFPACMSMAGSPKASAWAPSQVAVPGIQSRTLRQAYPRAPPIQVAAVS